MCRGGLAQDAAEGPERLRSEEVASWPVPSSWAVSDRTWLYLGAQGNAQALSVDERTAIDAFVGAPRQPSPAGQPALRVPEVSVPALST